MVQRLRESEIQRSTVQANRVHVRSTSQGMCCFAFQRGSSVPAGPISVHHCLCQFLRSQSVPFHDGVTHRHPSTRSEELKRPILVAKLGFVPLEERQELGDVRGVPLGHLLRRGVVDAWQLERLSKDSMEAVDAAARQKRKEPRAPEDGQHEAEALDEP